MIPIWKLKDRIYIAIEYEYYCQVGSKWQIISLNTTSEVSQQYGIIFMQNVRLLNIETGLEISIPEKDFISKFEDLKQYRDIKINKILQ